MTDFWHKLAGLSAAVLLSLFATQAVQAAWSSQLEAGGELAVDPRTNRATITRGGVTTPAWDGVHQLQDGTTLIIRSGQAVPNESILRARQLPAESVTDQAEAWIGTPIVGYSSCEKLVRQVCGVNSQCEQSPACEPARQLLEMERQERTAASTPNIMTYSSGQCMQAFKDKAFFARCTQQ